jgi:predicted nucleic acid-binding protein
MKPYVIIPDSSVLLKIAFQDRPDEQDAARALQLLQAWLAGTYAILLPSHWIFEVANVVALKVPDMANDYMKMFFDFQFESIALSTSLCREAFRLMKKYKVAFYDAIYHAVAISNKGLFVTADEAYYKKAKAEGHINLLRDFSP